MRIIVYISDSNASAIIGILFGCTSLVICLICLTTILQLSLPTLIARLTSDSAFIKFICEH